VLIYIYTAMSKRSSWASSLFASSASILRITLTAALTSHPDFLPVYFQSCKDASAIRSALLGLGVAALAPAAIVAGVAVSKTQRYRPQMWAGWCIIIVGLGLLSTVRQDTPTLRTFFFGVITGVGLG
jgi:hypothetical protein